ncbi:hypothetical protein NF699_13960 [Sphingomonadaceae bacterium OTU29LAMAA1]|nr:hypothetical protein NF699_13960 [Sphingomonadaceae bacterium OTU29LAMAA1]
MQRHHFAIGPEARTVLLQVPAFIGRALFCQRAAHFDTCMVGWLTADILCGPSRGPFGTAVPVGNQTIITKADDREINRAPEDRLLSNPVSCRFLDINSPVRRA